MNTLSIYIYLPYITYIHLFLKIIENNFLNNKNGQWLNFKQVRIIDRSDSCVRFSNPLRFLFYAIPSGHSNYLPISLLYLIFSKISDEYLMDARATDTVQKCRIQIEMIVWDIANRESNAIL